MFENEDGIDAFELFGKYGAQANAFTSFDKTAYLFSSTDHFYDSLEILLNFVTHPYFTPETVAKEQGIIGQEIAMTSDNPDNSLLFGLLGAMYKTHNVRIEIGGSEESIKKITAPLLYKCYEMFYNLRNMVLCISGDCDIDKILGICDRVLKEAPEFDVEIEALPESAEVYKKTFTKRMLVPTPMFAIGIKDIEISTDGHARMRKRAAMQIISDILFGSSGEFYYKHYEDGSLTDGLDVWGEHNRSFSLITISGRGPDPEALFADYRELIDRTKRNGLPRDDFERCKKLNYSAFIRAFNSTSSIAYNIVDFVLDDADMLGYADVVGSLEYEEVNSIFNKVFREEYTSYATVLPLESEEG